MSGVLQLRTYQERAIRDVREAFATGKSAVCLVMPCGAGKTVVSAAMIASELARDTRTLFIADRTTLIDQTVNKLAAAGVRDVRVIQANRDEGNPTAPVTIATPQTLRTPRWLSRLPEADLVIWDEVHHILARSFHGLARRYPNARRLGLTATACRGDGRALGDAFEVLLVGATIRELTELGHLAPARVFAPPAKLGQNEIALDPVTAYRERAGGQRAALFCSTVSQANRYVAAFHAAGITAEVVTAKTRNRADVLRRFASGAFDVLASVGTLTEGWDDPACAVAIVARKPAHAGLWLQICGRVLRAAPGKTHGVIVDLRGAVHDHGLPDEDRVYSLHGKPIRSVDQRSAIRQCSSCGAVFRAAGACPSCGALLEQTVHRSPRATNVGVVEVTRSPTSLQGRPWFVAMTAKRDDHCVTCGQWFPPGTPIFWTSGRRPKHQRCPRPAPSAEGSS